MTSRDFCYWLQGFFEINAKTPRPPEPLGGDFLNGDQVECIRRHLALVFKHEIDPSAGPPEHQKELDAIHSPKMSLTTESPIDLTGKPRPQIGGQGPDGILYRC